MPIEDALILTVTLNPALDLSARVDAMIAGPKLRLSESVLEPGGGGVNVARAIHALGGPALAWVALGGSSGDHHLALMRAQGLRVQAFAAPGETRQNWAITDAKGQQYRLQLPGMAWDTARAATAMQDILTHTPGPVVLSGSQPPGVSDTFPHDLAASLGPDRLVVDTSGAALSRLVEAPRADAPLWLLRLDQAEAEALAGQPLTSPRDSAAFARRLVERSVASMVCIARGADGSVLVGPDMAHHCRPPVVSIVSKVGAGDSFTGAFTHALVRGQTPAQALHAGTAAAAAAVMTPGTALCDPADVARLLPDCVLTDL